MEKETQQVLIEAARAQNKAIREGYQNDYLNEELGSLKEAYGIDLKDKKTFPLTVAEGWKVSWRGLKEAAKKLSGRVREAVGENTVGQVLRGATLALCNNWYELVPPEHSQIFLEQPSTGPIELYPIVQRGGQPRRAVRGNPAQETDLKGIDQQMINYLFLGRTVVERSLIDDDKVGVIMQRIQDLGTTPQYVEDAWSMQRLIGSAGTVPGTNDPIPASATAPANELNGWPWSTGFVGGGVNYSGSDAVMSEGLIQTLDINAENMVDLQGNKLLVKLTHIWAGTAYKWALKQVLGSSNYMSTVPMVQGAASTGGPAGSLTVGTTFSKNVLEGAYTPFVSRFLPKTAWGMIEAMKGWAFQRRSANELVQEALNSSDSLKLDAYIYHLRARWNVDALDPRFGQCGSKGSK